ncbi:hypothetical protein GUJ93_ZPchr0012g21058 [Zizania palustris]|uniref:Bifunctional inhibitor/plant lipid transfer protein/seed storage helical domain-containing protein n=1 Tax=Zizania palustris TaxID=103762 RepID=A0A8J5WRH6_ZIZPA|nr:hypothetical protein GUJ93_ZPchr0012g21058 [Zizania palustris]
MKIIFILALLSLAASSSFALIDTCSQGYGQWQQWQQQQMLHPCRELLRQQCSTVALPLMQPRMWQMSSCSVMRQQCCQQLRQMAQQSRCQAICTMAQSIMHQMQQAAGFSGSYFDQTQAQAQAQEAMNLPSMCGIYPGHCSTPCSVATVYGGCY